MKVNNKIKLLKITNTLTFKKKEIIRINPFTKKALHIIFKFHSITGNKILFVGSYNQIDQDFLNNSPHVFMPTQVWKYGFLTNKQSIIQQLQLINKGSAKEKFKMASTLFKLARNPNLIVILDEKNTKTIIDEGYITRIPIITVGADINDQKSSYKIPKEIMDKNQNYFFLEILHAILKLKPKRRKLQPNVVKKWWKNKKRKYKRHFYNYKKRKYRHENNKKNNQTPI
jgi:ribosomal protein S2